MPDVLGLMSECTCASALDGSMALLLSHECDEEAGGSLGLLPVTAGPLLAVAWACWLLLVLLGPVSSLPTLLFGSNISTRQGTIRPGNFQGVRGSKTLFSNSCAHSSDENSMITTLFFPSSVYPRKPGREVQDRKLSMVRRESCPLRIPTCTRTPSCCGAGCGKDGVDSGWRRTGVKR